MRIYDDSGLCIKEKSALHIDSRKQGSLNIISHAHSDHSSTNAKCKYLMSLHTKELLNCRIGKAEAKAVDFGKKQEHNEFSITLHNSGHILGSAQVEIENGSRVVVTSDFKLQDSMLMKRAEVLPSDILVIETTFGLPKYSFPEREEVCQQIADWVKQEAKRGRFVVLGGYAVGKAQELTKIVNEYTDIIPLVNEKIYENNKIYEANGVKLGDYIKLSHNLNDSQVLIMPPPQISPDLSTILNHYTKRHVVSAVATGWPSSFYHGTKVFPLSDHADFSQLLQYVKESGPKMVFTEHGYAREFANYVRRRLKINARPLVEKGQSLLNEFAY